MIFGNQQSLAARGWDVFVAKYDPKGQCLWVTQGGGVEVDEGRGISVDELGNVYVTGSFYGGSAQFGTFTLTGNNGSFTMFIAKFDSSGKPVWVKQADGYSKVNGISSDSAGNSTVTGFIMGLTAFDRFTVGPTTFHGRAFLARYDSQGACAWAATNTSGAPVGSDVTLDAQGGCIIAGTYSSRAEFGNQEIVGSVNGYNLFMCKYGSQGNFIGVKNPDSIVDGSIMPIGGIRERHCNHRGRRIISGLILSFMDSDYISQRRLLLPAAGWRLYGDETPHSTTVTNCHERDPEKFYLFSPSLSSTSSAN